MVPESDAARSVASLVPTLLRAPLSGTFLLEGRMSWTSVWSLASTQPGSSKIIQLEHWKYYSRIIVVVVVSGHVGRGRAGPGSDRLRPRPRQGRVAVRSVPAARNAREGRPLRPMLETMLLPNQTPSTVYDILPSTTAVFSYAIGSRKLSANSEQFFVGSKFVTNNSNKTRRVINSQQQSLHQHK